MKTRILLLVILISATSRLFAQEPALPPTNLGLANVFDGIAGKPGFVYQGYVQVFQTRDPKDVTINSVVTLHQLIYLSKVRVLGGNLGFTIIVPVAQINAAGGPTVNPKAWGDMIYGTAVQWSGKRFSHRAELDISLPTGAYSSKYAINPSAHLYSFGVYHAFTLLLNEHFSISARNQFNYNTHIIGTNAQPGTFYNGNYSVDYSLLKSLKVEAAAYYLTEFNQHSQERVLGYGPGLAYFFPGGGLMEVKGFVETAAKNRVSGIRPTLRVAIPLSK